MSAPLIGSAWQIQLLDLGGHWFRDGNAMITREAIATVEGFATVPKHNGGIQLEIHRDGFDIEICIGPDGRIESVLVGSEPKERS